MEFLLTFSILAIGVMAILQPLGSPLVRLLAGPLLAAVALTLARLPGWSWIIVMGGLGVVILVLMAQAIGTLFKRG